MKKLDIIEDAFYLEKKLKYILSFIALFYLVSRFVFFKYIEVYGTYATYYFEIICVLIFCGLYGFKKLLNYKLDKFLVCGVVLNLIAGFLVLKFANILNINIPFDFNTNETLIFLLGVAPALEEFLFRWLLFIPLFFYFKNHGVIVLISALLFSYSHFHSYWIVPDQYFSFIYYQTFYTFILGWVCAEYLVKHQSLISAMLIHFSFNLGFYLATLF